MAGIEVSETVLQHVSRYFFHLKVGEFDLDFLQNLRAFLLHLKEDALLVAIKDAEYASKEAKGEDDTAKADLEYEGIVPLHGVVIGGDALTLKV